MAESYSTLGTRFAESKILAKNKNIGSSEPILYKKSTDDVPDGLSSRLFVSVQKSNSNIIPNLNNGLPELMSILRSHINDVLRLPLSAQSRSRLVRNYWELEFLVEEIRLILD